MKTLLTLLGHPQAVHLGWTLAHFIWEGSLLGAIWLGLRHVLRRRSPELRYRVACLILVCMAAAPPVTWTVLRAPSAFAAPSLGDVAGAGDSSLNRRSLAGAWVPMTSGVAGDDFVSWAGRLGRASDAMMPWFALLWIAGVLAGVLAGAARLGAGAGRVVAVRRRSRAVDDAALVDRLRQLEGKLGLNRPVRLLKSAWVEVPTVVGWFRPAILLPVSNLIGIDPRQLEFLLAHELAHIRRHDQWVNLIQVTVETLLFYHPAVWWVSRDIRQEREHCCDDLAVRICGDRLDYVRALATIEEWRQFAPGLSLGAGGGSLIKRVRRLLFVERAESDWRRVAGSTLLLLGVLITVAGAAAWWLSPKYFEASARIEVLSDRGNEWVHMPRPVPAATPAERTDYLADAMAALRSRSLVEVVLRQARSRNGLKGSRTASDVVPDSEVDDLVARIRVQRVPLTSLVELTVRADTSEKAAELANALVDEFVEQNLLRWQKSALAHLFFLRSQATSLELELSRNEDALQAYRRASGFVSLGPGENTPAQALAAAQLQLGEALSRAARAASTVEELNRHRDQGETIDTFPPLASDPQLRQLRLELIRLETEFSGLRKSLADEHPQVQQAQAKIEATRKALERMGRDSMESLRAEARLAKASVEAQQELVKRWTMDAQKWQEARIAYSMHESKVETSRALYQRVLTRMKEIELVQKDKANNVRVADKASSPPIPVHPLRPPALVLAGVGLLLGSLGLAILRGLNAAMEARGSADPEAVRA